MKERWLSPKVSDAMMSYKDGPDGGFVRWKCVWLKSHDTAVASEWIPVKYGGEALVVKMGKEVNEARRKLGL